MKPRKDSRKSELRQNERMIREMQAWIDTNIPHRLALGLTERDRTILGMLKQAFIAGWRSKNLKQHEPALRASDA